MACPYYKKIKREENSLSNWRQRVSFGLKFSFWWYQCSCYTFFTSIFKLKYEPTESKRCFKNPYKMPLYHRKEICNLYWWRLLWRIKMPIKIKKTWMRWRNYTGKIYQHFSCKKTISHLQCSAIREKTKIDLRLMIATDQSSWWTMSFSSASKCVLLLLSSQK